MTKLEIYIEKALGGIDSRDFQRRFWVLRNNAGEDNPVVNQIRAIAEKDYIILDNLEPTFKDIVKVQEYKHLFEELN